VLAVSTGGLAHAQEKIGFVNLDRILREAGPAQRAQKKLEAEFSKREQELAKSADQIKKMQENLEKNGMTMSESDRRNREREFGEANREFQRRQREIREDFNQRRNEELGGILERANRAVRQIAESEKFDIIFQEAVYANPRIDITDKVIRALDDSAPAKK
jgi:outer membrane protein